MCNFAPILRHFLCLFISAFAFIPMPAHAIRDGVFGGPGWSCTKGTVISGGIAFVYIDCFNTYNPSYDYTYFDSWDNFAGGGGTLDDDPPQVFGPGFVSTTCDEMEELRLAAANPVAFGMRFAARRGDHFVAVNSDGSKEVWEFMCGGAMCGPTVLKPAPISSQCH